MSTDPKAERPAERRAAPGPTGAGGRAVSFPAMLRMAGWAGLLLVCLVSRAAAAEPELRLSPKKIRDEVRTVAAAQLAALRAGDFATAYGFAAEGIKRQFDARLFAALIKRGYPALLRPGQPDLGIVRDNGDGLAQILVTVTDRQNRSTVYRYLLEKEEAGWRISGVRLEQRPPRGDI